MLLNRKLQLMHNHVPFRATLIEGTGRKFADSIFQTATGHFGHERSAGLNEMPVVAKVLDDRRKETTGRHGEFSDD